MHVRLFCLSGLAGPALTMAQLDICDSKNRFGIELPISGMSYHALQYALLALSSRQQGLVRSAPSPDPLESTNLLQMINRVLGPDLRSGHEGAISVCVVLTIIHVISTAPYMWRTYLKDIVAVFNTLDIHGFRTGIIQAVFWCFVRLGRQLLPCPPTVRPCNTMKASFGFSALLLAYLSGPTSLCACGHISNSSPVFFSLPC